MHTQEAAPAAAGMDGAGGGGYPPGHPYAAYGAYGGADQQQQQLQQQQHQPQQPQQAQQQLYGNAEAGGYVDPSQAQLYQQQLYQQQTAAFGQQGGQQMTQEQLQWCVNVKIAFSKMAFWVQFDAIELLVQFNLRPIIPCSS